MWIVERRAPSRYGNSVGTKEFNSYEEAEKWLNSNSVLLDREEGFSFSLKEKI